MLKRKRDQKDEEFQFSTGFDEGDVEFVIPQVHKIRIHSVILKSASRFFAVSMSSRWAGLGGDADAAPDERGVRWTYVLELDQRDPSGDIFKRRSSTAPTPYVSENRGVSSFRAIDNLFRIICHRTPNFTSLEDCIALTRLSDKYDCLDFVSQAVRAAVLDSPRLKSCIKQNPISFLALAEEIKSPMILRKAANRVIGKWADLADELVVHVSEELYLTLESKRSDLEEMRAKLRSELLSFDINIADYSTFSQRSWQGARFMLDCIADIYQRYDKMGDTEYGESYLYQSLLNIEQSCEKRSEGYDLIFVLEYRIKEKVRALVREHLHPSLSGELVVNPVRPKLTEEELPWNAPEDWLCCEEWGR